MNTWYLNANSSTQDGLTADTGYHNLATLQSSRTLLNGDIIRLVNNGTISDGSLSISPSILIVPDGGLSDKPTWALSGDNYFSGTGTVSISGIILTGSAWLRFNGCSTGIVDSCDFNVTGFSPTSGTIYMTNNIFRNGGGLGGLQTWFSPAAARVNNNVFYNYTGPYGALYNWDCHDYTIKNNIFQNCSICYRQGTATFNPDYNIYYNCSNFSPGGVNPHELVGIDPLLTDPAGGNFTLQAGSPCLLTGVGPSIDISIPDHDFIDVLRTGSTSDMGVYESIHTPAAPSITGQPASQTIDYGNPVTFNVTATGYPALLYQWYKDSSTIPSATSNTYTINPVTPANDGTYNVVVYNGVLPDATSNDATLSVHTAVPLFINQPDSTSVRVGGHFSLSSYASGIPAPTYQWYKNDEFNPISGATDATYTVSMSSSSDAGSYYVDASNMFGQTDSDLVTVTLTPVIPYLIDAASPSPAYPYQTLANAAHNFGELLNDSSGVFLLDGDIIQVADGTVVDDSADPIVISDVNLRIEAYYPGRTRKPTVKLAPSTFGFIYSGMSQKLISISDMIFTCDSTNFSDFFITDSGVAGVRSYIQACEFNKVAVDIANPVSFSFVNNLVIHLGDTSAELDSVTLTGAGYYGGGGGGLVSDVIVANNTFFKWVPHTSALLITGSAENVKIENNAYRFV